MAWPFSLGKGPPAFFSGVIPSVGGTTRVAMVMFAHPLGIVSGSDLGFFGWVRGCRRATEGRSSRTSRRQSSVNGSTGMVDGLV